MSDSGCESDEGTIGYQWPLGRKAVIYYAVPERQLVADNGHPKHYEQLLGFH